MEIALAVSFLLLLALTFLATVDMAFGQLSDVGLRRLAAEAEEHPKARYAPLLAARGLSGAWRVLWTLVPVLLPVGDGLLVAKKVWTPEA